MGFNLSLKRSDRPSVHHFNLVYSNETTLKCTLKIVMDKVTEWIDCDVSGSHFLPLSVLLLFQLASLSSRLLEGVEIWYGNKKQSLLSEAVCALSSVNHLLLVHYWGNCSS